MCSRRTTLRSVSDRVRVVSSTRRSRASAASCAQLGPVENSATEGALLAKEPGNAVRITFSQDHGQAVNIMAAYHRFAPEPMRRHLADVLSAQKNATLLWTITPPSDELQRVLGCLK